MFDFYNSTHFKNWIFTKEQLERERQRKHNKLRLCIARAMVQEQLKSRTSPGNQKAMVAFYARRYLSSPEAGNKAIEKEMITPLIEQVYINHFINLILKTWPELPLNVKVLLEFVRRTLL